MSNITAETMKKLISVGFSFPQYEHLANCGMMFFYEDEEYTIGGFSEHSLSKKDFEVAQNGVWLPDENHLMLWLKLVGFSFKITWELSTQYFSVVAVDGVNNHQYLSSGIVLVDTLAKLIYKICKSQLRVYDISDEQILRLEIKE